MNNGLRINRSANRAIAAARRLVTHFRKSEPASRALKGRQADMRTPAHNLIQDVMEQYLFYDRTTFRTAMASDCSIS